MKKNVLLIVLLTFICLGLTSCKNVYVGGDAMHGPQTVVLAMKTGRTAAKAIHETLMN